MKFFGRSAAPLVQQPALAETLPSDVTTLQPQIEGGEVLGEFSMEQFVEQNEQALTSFGALRRESKECIAEALSPEWHDTWRSIAIKRVVNSGQRENIPITRLEKRLNQNNEKNWTSHILMASQAARLYATTESSTIGASGILQKLGVSAPEGEATATNAIQYFLDTSDPDSPKIRNADDRNVFLKEREVYEELKVIYSKEEIARNEVIDGLLAQLGGDIDRWHTYAMWIAAHAQADLKQKPSPVHNLIRIIAEDMYDPERGLLIKAHGEIAQKNEQTLVADFLRNETDTEGAGPQEKAALEAIKLAAVMYGTSIESPAFADRFISLKEHWPQSVRGTIERYIKDFTGSIIDDIHNAVLNFDTGFSRKPRPEDLMAFAKSFYQPDVKSTHNRVRNPLEKTDALIRQVEEAEPTRPMRCYLGGIKNTAVEMTPEVTQNAIKDLMRTLGQDERLSADATKILTSIMESPFEKGTTRISEIKRVSVSLPTESTTANIYRVNVAHRRITTSTKKAKDLRVLFAQSDDNLVIIGIYNHADYEAAIKNLR